MSNSKPSKSNSQNEHLLIGNWMQIVRILLFSASIITLYLATLTLSQGNNIPGCGPDSDCSKVLNSPWAYWLGIPVSIPGLCLYVVFLLKTFGIKNKNISSNQKKYIRSLNTLTLCAFGAIGAGIWFIGIQYVAIKSFCPYCCAAHALAMTASGIFLAQSGTIANRLNVKINITGGILTMTTLIVGVGGTQTLFPKQMPAPKIVELKNSATNTIPLNNQTSPTTEINRATITEKNINAKETPFPIPKTELSLITSNLPIIGDRNATNRFAVMFDYTCHHCRKLHSFVRQIIPKYENKLSCIMIPMPLDSKCNPLIKTTHADHVNACDYTKICLAIHQIAPDKYEEFDKWLFNNHNQIKPYSTVLEYAEGITSKDSINEAMNSQPVLDQLATNIEVYKLNSKNGNTSIMPQAIIKSRVMFGPPPSVEALENLLNQFLDLK